MRNEAHRVIRNPNAAAANDDPAALVQVSRSHLSAQLQQVWQNDSRIVRRDAVAELRGQLLDPQSALRAPSSTDDSVTLSAGYLLAELDQIAAARTRERAEYYVKRLIRALNEERTGPINDLNLNRWKEYADIYTDSLWLLERRDNSGVHTAGYWGNFVPQIPYQMMRRYTKKGEWVLDTFAGLGTTLIEGQRLGRNTLGIELQAHVAQQARQLIAAESNDSDVVAEVICADCTTVDYPALLAQYGQQSVQLVLMHPPYFDIIKFSNDARDLSNAHSVRDFLAAMRQAVNNVAQVLDQGRYLILVIGDKYSQGEWIPLGFLTMQVAQEQGFTLKSIVVKNFEETTGKRAQKELWAYRALVGGFYIFKHEYIFVFRKT